MYVRPTGHHLSCATPREFVDFIITYVELLLALWEARGRGLPSRANPVVLSRLREKGVADHILLWMMYQEHVEHLRPPPNVDNGGPAVAPAGSLLLSPCSSFALTEVGEAFAGWFLCAAFVLQGEREFDAAWEALMLGRLAPRYDKENRVLSWGRHVLKVFRQPSVNQELILRAAEELGWAEWIDDPLPRRPGTNPKVRLHDTIKDLNRRQEPHLIHFKGDGTGTRLGWEYR